MSQKITSFNNKQVLRELRTAIDQAVATVAADYGISLRVDKITYNDMFAKFGLEASVFGQGEVPVSRTAEDFKNFCYRYGLKPEHLNQEFLHGGKRWRLIGLKAGASRRPFQIQDVLTGKIFVAEEAMVLSGLGISALHGAIR